MAKYSELEGRISELRADLKTIKEIEGLKADLAMTKEKIQQIENDKSAIVRTIFWGAIVFVLGQALGIFQFILKVTSG